MAPAIHEQLIEIATQGDAAWFAKHPDRRMRIRNAVAAEFEDDVGQAPAGMAWHTLVLEAQPGARLRQPIALPVGTDGDAMTDETLFGLFIEVSPPGAKQLVAKLRAAKLAR
jgi:hypothetical protein